MGCATYWLKTPASQWRRVQVINQNVLAAITKINQEIQMAPDTHRLQYSTRERTT